MVEVFKTNVEKQNQATKLVTILSQQFPPFKINFDLEDCDKVLRVEGKNVSAEKIVHTLKLNGYQCQVLD